MQRRARGLQRGHGPGRDGRAFGLRLPGRIQGGLHFPKDTRRSHQQGDDSNNRRQYARGFAGNAYHGRLQDLGGLLAHEPTQLRHDRVLRSIPPDRQSGNRDHNEQNRSNRSDCIEGNGSPAAQRSIIDEAQNCLLQHLPRSGEHIKLESQKLSICWLQLPYAEPGSWMPAFFLTEGCRPPATIAARSAPSSPSIRGSIEPQFFALSCLNTAKPVASMRDKTPGVIPGLKPSAKRPRAENPVSGCPFVAGRQISHMRRRFANLCLCAMEYHRNSAIILSVVELIRVSTAFTVTVHWKPARHGGIPCVYTIGICSITIM